MNSSNIVKKEYFERNYNPQLKFSGIEAKKKIFFGGGKNPYFLNSVFSLVGCDIIVYFPTIQKV